MKITLFAIIALVLLTSPGYCQDTQQLMEQLTNVYSGDNVSGNSLIAGFSLSGLLGGLLFGSIGFVAFIYGKKNSEFRPMITGILLMGYPYLVKGTLALYLVGVVLTVVLFVWRD